MRLAVCVLLCGLAAGEARAQPAAGEAAPDLPFVRATARDVTRLESWSFFDPGEAIAETNPDPDYAFLGNRITFGITAEGARWRATGALQYVQLWNLPSRAFAAGPLGTGALYYVAALQPRAYQLYPRLLNFTWKDAPFGTSIVIGRQPYASSGEAPTGVPALDALERARLDERLIGDFEWSIVQRAFDGFRVDVDRARWHASTALLMPTQGVYEESATPTMTDLQVVAATLSIKPAAGRRARQQAFAYLYRDRRGVEARPDNSRLAADAADVTIATIGGSHAGLIETPAGDLDTVLWGAVQSGDWYGQRHRAFSLAAEAGHRFTRIQWRPWIRGGWLYASGDDDPADSRHGTFFQMLPNVRRYAPSTVYSLMNVRDAFAQASIEPFTRLRLYGELHRVRLATASDRWYSGSGATSRSGPYFGYSTRPSGGGTTLGTVLDLAGDVQLRPYWSVNGYVGRMWGGDVVRRSFAGNRLTFFYLENVLSF